MANHLVDETSPYLLQHADNPVDWYPWGDEAFSTAKSKNLPVFLSIGYAACHWCHVMERESFEDPIIAEILNKNFINIKVDREERPDIDTIYMAAVVGLTGQGGWPMSLFLTPDGKPFYGGTYFPPVRRFNRPSFGEILSMIVDLWKHNSLEIIHTAQKVTEHLKNSWNWGILNKETISSEGLFKAAKILIDTFNTDIGGWGTPPLFPAPMAIDFLFTQATRDDQKAKNVALNALRAMQKGGIYDVIGGGFHRYSTDESWLVPHFEKMLYDNAQLSRAYLHGYLLSGDDSLKRTCLQTLNFILRELTSPEGAFFSSLDADSEGEEGIFYTWSDDDIRKALPDKEDLLFLNSVYSLSSQGNFEGKNILQRKNGIDDEAIASRLGTDVQSFRQKLDQIHSEMLSFRSQRIRPSTDDKVIVFWNALTLQAFSEAARYLSNPDYLKAAQTNADFLLNYLYTPRGLMRSWRINQARHFACLEDYGALILALLSLFQSDFNSRWFQAALILLDEMETFFEDKRNGGFFTRRIDQPDVIVNPKEYQDNVTPSGNSLAALIYIQMAAFTGNQRWRDKGEKLLSEIQPLAVQQPMGFAMWLQALDFGIGPVQEIAIIYPEEKVNLDFPFSFWQEYRPRSIIAVTGYPPDNSMPEIAMNRAPIDNQTTAYICRNMVCSSPITDLEDFRLQLLSTHTS